jgi:hypothetical protein
MATSPGTRSGIVVPAPLADQPVPPRDESFSFKRVLGWAILGSVTMILVVLAARPDPMEDVEARVDRVIGMYAAGDREGACKAAAGLAVSDPSEPRVWLLVGMLAEDARKNDEAVHAYQTALGVMEPSDPGRIDVLVTLADLRRRKGDPAGALAEIDKLAQEHGVSGRIRHARVLSLIDLRRFDEALSDTRLIAEERFGGGVAKKLEKQIRSLMDAEARKDD